MMSDGGVYEFLGDSTSDIKERTFAVISLNNYMNFIPGEVGVTVFNLQDGIKAIGCRLFDPEMDLVYHEVSEAVEKYKLPKQHFQHQYGKYPALWDCGTKDPMDVLQMIMSAMEDANEGQNAEFRYVCFTQEDKIKEAEYTIRWLKREANFGGFNPIIFSFEELVTKMSALENGPFRYLQVPTHLFKYDETFRNIPSLACSWHQQKQFDYYVSCCALLKCQNQIYIALRGLCPLYEIKMQKEIHFPIPPPNLVQLRSLVREVIPKYGESLEECVEREKQMEKEREIEEQKKQANIERKERAKEEVKRQRMLHDLLRKSTDRKVDAEAHGVTFDAETLQIKERLATFGILDGFKNLKISSDSDKQ